jgi:serine/threonine protein kinase
VLHTKQFGNYDIIRKLGRGMTDVYLAFDTQANRHAVLKIVEDSPDPMTQLIMQAERRGAALQQQLHEFDPRVIEVYEYGDRDGCFFLSMQYIEGRTVAEILKEEKRIEPKRAARFAAEICSQLDKLHSFLADIDGQKRAVVHGDIKPSNIQIGSNDELRLLDFGIAKAITFTHSLTHHNLGSPSYCSPERLSRGQVDHHADLWAVGVTLYEMVAGTPPYQAQDTRKLENLILSRRPPRALPDDCPSGLKAVITKALAGDLHQRYVSAAAFESDVRLFLQDRATVAERQKRVAWNTNATVEKSKDDEDQPSDHQNSTISKPVSRWRPTGLIAKWKPGWSTARIAAVLSILSALFWGLLAGLLVFIPAGYYYTFRNQSALLREKMDFGRETVAQINVNWDLYRRLEKQNRFLGDFSPVRSLYDPLRSNLLAAADEIIDRYRTSSDPTIQDFDWQKGQLCLHHLVDLGERDKSIRGKLALCTGYVALLHGQAEAPGQRTQWTDKARASFTEAADLLPRAPDPHLALARISVYESKNVGKAMAEFHEAQRLGYQLGPREMEEEADGYRIRASQELSEARNYRKSSRELEERYLRLARRDFDRARQLYEPIAGFSNVSVALRQVDDDDRARQQMDDYLKQPPPRKRTAGVRRRWQ